MSEHGVMRSLAIELVRSIVVGLGAKLGERLLGVGHDGQEDDYDDEESDDDDR